MRTPLPAALVLLLWPLLASSGGPTGDETEQLQHTIAALDHAAFDSFNRCAQPDQLALHASYFDENVEFYHDTGGVTWNREAMLANTRQHACGHYRRELVDGSLVVHPLKDFGALAVGQHRFCDLAGGNCEGLADFSIVWHLQQGQWRITRVLSYGHRPLPQSGR